MNLRPSKVIAPQSGSRLDKVLRAGLNISTFTPQGKYILFGNEVSDWAIQYFHNYDEYLKEWQNWDRQGWLHPGNREPLNRDGERVLPQSPPREYDFMNKKDYKRRVFYDYDEYLQEWQAAVDNNTIFAPGLRYTRDGGLEKLLMNGKWERVPYAS